MARIGKGSTVEEMRELFSAFKKVVDVYIPNCQGTSHGFVFIRFKFHKEANNLLRRKPRIRIRGRRVQINHASRFSSESSSKTVSSGSRRNIGKEPMQDHVHVSASWLTVHKVNHRTFKEALLGSNEYSNMGETRNLRIKFSYV